MKKVNLSKLMVVVLIVCVPLDNVCYATSRGEHVDDRTISVLVNYHQSIPI